MIRSILNKLGFNNKDSFYIGKESFKKERFYFGYYKIISSDNKYGLIDSKERIVLSPIYDDIEGSIEGSLLWLVNGDKIGFFNDNNRKTLPPLYDKIEPLEIRHGYFVVQKAGKYGIVDLGARKIIDTKYDHIEYLDKSVDVLLLKNKGRFIISNNHFLSDYITYDAISRLDNGLYQTQKDGLLGLVSNCGKTILKPIHAWVSNEIESGLICFLINGQYGFVDIDGNVIIDGIYDNVGNFAAGVTYIKKNGRYGLIDIEGNVVVKPTYDWIGDKVKDGLIKYKQNNKYGVLDTKGCIVIKAQFDNLQYFEKGVIKVEQNNKVFYVDRKGNRLNI